MPLKNLVGYYNGLASVGSLLLFRLPFYFYASFSPFFFVSPLFSFFLFSCFSLLLFSNSLIFSQRAHSTRPGFYKNGFTYIGMAIYFWPMTGLPSLSFCQSNLCLTHPRSYYSKKNREKTHFFTQKLIFQGKNSCFWSKNV